MICTEYTTSLDRYLFDQTANIIQAMLDDNPNTPKNIKEEFKQLRKDFDMLYDIAYDQAQILDNIKTELE